MSIKIYIGVEYLILQEFLDDNREATISFPSENRVKITQEEFEEALSNIDMKEVYKKIEEAEWIEFDRFINYYETVLGLIEEQTDYIIINCFLYKKEEKKSE